MQPNGQTNITPTKPVEIDKNSGGRPTVITNRVLSKLIASFQRGHNNAVSIRYAGIGEKTFYRNYAEDEEFRQKIDDAKDYALHLAGDIIVDTLNSKKAGRALRTRTAQWYLERKEPDEFGRKPLIELNDTTINNNQYNFISNDDLKRLVERAGITKLNPAKIVAALANGNVGRGEQPKTTVAVDIQKPRSQNSTEEGVSRT